MRPSFLTAMPLRLLRSLSPLPHIMFFSFPTNAQTVPCRDIFTSTETRRYRVQRPTQPREKNETSQWTPLLQDIAEVTVTVGMLGMQRICPHDFCNNRKFLESKHYSRIIGGKQGTITLPRKPARQATTV